jgi:hypothetical protein
MALRLLVAAALAFVAILPTAAFAVNDDILIPTGDRLDVERVNVGGTDVMRQRFQISGSGASDIAPVDANSGLRVSPRDASGNALSSILAGSTRAQAVAFVDGSGNHVTSLGGTSLADGATFSRGTTAHTTAGCVVETTAGSFSTGASRGIRCNDKAEQYVVVPDRGTTLFPLLSANSTNATLVRNGATVLYGCNVTNTNASPRVLKIYNFGSTPTVGTTAVFTRFHIPGTSGGVAGHVVGFPADGIALDTGFGIGLTTGVPDNDTGAVGANEIVLNCYYRAQS